MNRAPSEGVPPDVSQTDDGTSPAPDDAQLLERRPARAPLLALGLIVVVALGWLALEAFQGSVVYYLTPTEARDAAPDTVFRLAGHVADGSIAREASTGTLHFEITDGATTIPVRFDGRAPDSLTARSEAVAEGRFGADGVFEADSVLARCASRFEAEWQEP
jgi:cytochrome c-type biogenesis protein CcmE